jgi:hypothetical protein
MITNAPGRVAETAPVQHVAATKRTGLVPMRAGSQHSIKIRGVEHIVTARAHEDVRDAKSRVICLHANCVGRDWPSVDAMVHDHPQRTDMAKRGEVHVYGSWSDDAPSEGPRKVAEAERDRCDKMIAKCDTFIENAKTMADLTAAQQQKALAEAQKRAAEVEVAKHSGVLGLIAPPDRSVDG